MNDLYNELVGNTTVYLEDGKIDIKPPTSLSLRAARAIQSLTGQLQTTTTTANSLARELDNLNHIYNTFKEIYDRTNSVPTAERVCEGGREAGPVADGKHSDCDGNYFS